MKLQGSGINNEPSAAAIAYGYNEKSYNEEIVMVYDLGGGTVMSQS